MKSEKEIRQQLENLQARITEIAYDDEPMKLDRMESIQSQIDILEWALSK